MRVYDSASARSTPARPHRAETSVDANLDCLDPSTVQTSSYRDVFEKRPFARFLVNSLRVSLGTAVLTVALAALAAYPIARGRLRGAAWWDAGRTPRVQPGPLPGHAPSHPEPMSEVLAARSVALRLLRLAPARVEAFTRAIAIAGKAVLEDPMGAPQIPNWSRVTSAVPDLFDMLKAADEGDSK